MNSFERFHWGKGIVLAKRVSEAAEAVRLRSIECSDVIIENPLVGLLTFDP